MTCNDLSKDGPSTPELLAFFAATLRANPDRLVGDCWEECCERMYEARGQAFDYQNAQRLLIAVFSHADKTLFPKPECWGDEDCLFPRLCETLAPLSVAEACDLSLRIGIPTDFGDAPDYPIIERWITTLPPPEDLRGICITSQITPEMLDPARVMEVSPLDTGGSLVKYKVGMFCANFYKLAASPDEVKRRIKSAV